jgi:hypothetical protein
MTVAVILMGCSSIWYLGLDDQMHGQRSGGSVHIELLSSYLVMGSGDEKGFQGANLETHDMISMAIT